MAAAVYALLGRGDVEGLPAGARCSRRMAAAGRRGRCAAGSVIETVETRITDSSRLRRVLGPRLAVTQEGNLNIMVVH